MFLATFFPSSLLMWAEPTMVLATGTGAGMVWLPGASGSLVRPRPQDPRPASWGLLGHLPHLGRCRQ